MHDVRPDPANFPAAIARLPTAESWTCKTYRSDGLVRALGDLVPCVEGCESGCGTGSWIRFPQPDPTSYAGLTRTKNLAFAGKTRDVVLSCRKAHELPHYLPNLGIYVSSFRRDSDANKKAGEGRLR